ncbi:SusD/RagB family nutrient-binding outer membrane lipoprotein [Sinomicrobium soli]|nr:SusD/RagB family nutrient-binding outer membrane lipoprotein [Sinomicrobium sp. N-1-3-6]
MKKNIQIVIQSLLLLAAMVFVTSCEDFLDVNENPNDPPISTPNLTLPVAQQHFANLNGTEMTYLGNYFVYNWAVPSNWSANQEMLRYTITNGFYTMIFEESYGEIFRNLTYIETYEDEEGIVDYSAYKIISQVLKGFQYQYLVDLYGDVPYTEANQRAENVTPIYDDAETVYRSVIDSLTAAADLAMNMPNTYQDPGTADIMFGGDMELWAQFANTVKLRMLLRFSDTGQDNYIQEQIALIDANGAGYIDADVVANPGYSSGTDQQSPFWDYVGYDEGGNRQDRNRLTVATDYTISYLEDTNDPRLEYIYAPSADEGEYKGVYQSVELPGSGFTETLLSRVGPGLLKGPDQDQPIMLLAEALFLQSEAVVRGYIDGGDAEAKALYNEAITASFDYLGVEESVSDYYDQAIENVGWDASSDKIEAIITQKWVALNGTSSIESWVELTRTGFPADLPTSNSSTRGAGVYPVGLVYPASEYSRNSNNVPAKTTDDAFTQYPFWKGQN